MEKTLMGVFGLVVLSACSASEESSRSVSAAITDDSVVDVTDFDPSGATLTGRLHLRTHADTGASELVNDDGVAVPVQGGPSLTALETQGDYAFDNGHLHVTVLDDHRTKTEIFDASGALVSRVEAPSPAEGGSGGGLAPQAWWYIPAGIAISVTAYQAALLIRENACNGPRLAEAQALMASGQCKNGIDMGSCTVTLISTTYVAPKCLPACDAKPTSIGVQARTCANTAEGS